MGDLGLKERLGELELLVHLCQFFRKLTLIDAGGKVRVVVGGEKRKRKKQAAEVVVRRSLLIGGGLLTSCTAFSRARSDRRRALISACASPSSFSLSAQHSTAHERSGRAEEVRSNPNPRKRNWTRQMREIQSERREGKRAAYTAARSQGG
jgi:hypothetical protein